MSYKPLEAQRVQDLSDVANKIRIHSITCTKAANSGYAPTATSSLALVSDGLASVALLFDWFVPPLQAPHLCRLDG